MRHHLILSAIFVFFSCQAQAATTLISADGRLYMFGDWSVPDQIQVPSAKGKLPIARRWCTVSVANPRFPEIPSETFRVDLLMHSDVLWIGRQSEFYFIHEDVVFGASTVGNQLQIRGPESLGQEFSNPEDAIERSLLELVKNPHVAFLSDTATHSFDLRYLFGVNALIPIDDARAWLKPATITEIGVSSDAIIISLRTVAERSLEVVFDPGFEVKSATNDGKSGLIISDGRIPSEIPGWSPPLEIGVRSADGQLTGLTSSKHFYFSDGQESGRAIAYRSVITGDGQIWIGNPDCQVVMLNGRLIGVRFDSVTGDLVLSDAFRRVPPVPLKGDFVRELAAFENQLRLASPEEEHRFSISRLFPMHTGAADSDMSLRDIAVSGESLTVTVQTSVPRELLEATLDSNLRVIGNRVRMMGIPSIEK